MRDRLSRNFFTHRSKEHNEAYKNSHLQLRLSGIIAALGKQQNVRDEEGFRKCFSCASREGFFLTILAVS